MTPKRAVSVLRNESRRRVSLVIRFTEESLGRFGMFAKISRDLSAGETGNRYGTRDTDALNPESWRESILVWFSSQFVNPPCKQHIIERRKERAD